MFSCPLFGAFLQPQVKVFRGNKAETWCLLEDHIHCWPTVAMPATENGAELAPEDRASALRVQRGDKVTFENLWAPLNSVPLLKASLMGSPVWEQQPDVGGEEKSGLEPEKPQKGRSRRAKNEGGDVAVTVAETSADAVVLASTPDNAMDNDDKGDGGGSAS